jgi:hypothetical protein
MERLEFPPHGFDFLSSLCAIVAHVDEFAFVFQCVKGVFAVHEVIVG